MSLPRIRLGMVGGGSGAFIGAVHRHAAQLDGRYELCAGALSSTPQRALESAQALGLPPGRGYPTWQAMLEGERRRPAGERVEVVAVVTPNHTHYAIARGFVDAGFHVICDKPLTTRAEDARALADAVARAGVVFAVTYNYTGYPMIRQAAAMVRAGEIGRVRKVFVEYHQGWLASSLEAEGQKQAAWRTDPAQAGAGGAIGDIGSHAENLVWFVTGLEVESLCADLRSFVPGRRLDDDASVLLRFKGGAGGVLTASQVCIGEENNLTLRVHGDAGSLWWRQEEPNTLIHADASGGKRLLTRGSAGLHPAAAAATRLPAGHPEAFIEAFANIYSDVAAAVLAHRQGNRPATPPPYPTIGDGVRGVEFIERVVASAARGGGWD